MNQQIEIKEYISALSEDGSPAVPGWCRRNLYLYNKEKIRRRRRIKEWDFYLVTDGRCKVELNFFNISWLSALTAEYTDLATGECFSDAVIRPSSPDKYVLSPAADEPFPFRIRTAADALYSKQLKLLISCSFPAGPPGKDPERSRLRSASKETGFPDRKV